MRKAGLDFYNLSKMGRLGQYKQNMLSAMSGEQPDQMAMNRARLQYDPQGFNGSGGMTGGQSQAAGDRAKQGEASLRINQWSAKIEEYRLRTGEEAPKEWMDSLYQASADYIAAGGKEFRQGLNTKVSEEVLRGEADVDKSKKLVPDMTILNNELLELSRTGELDTPRGLELKLALNELKAEYKDLSKKDWQPLENFNAARSGNRADLVLRNTIGKDANGIIAHATNRYEKATNAVVAMSKARRGLSSLHAKAKNKNVAAQYLMVKLVMQVIEPNLSTLESEAQGVSGLTEFESKFNDAKNVVKTTGGAAWDRIQGKTNAQIVEAAKTGSLREIDVDAIYGAAVSAYSGMTKGIEEAYRQAINHQSRTALRNIQYPEWEQFDVAMDNISVGSRGEIRYDGGQEVAPAPAPGKKRAMPTTDLLKSTTEANDDDDDVDLDALGF